MIQESIKNPKKTSDLMNDSAANDIHVCLITVWRRLLAAGRPVQNLFEKQFS